MKKTFFLFILGIFLLPNLTLAIYDPENPSPTGEGITLMNATAEPTLISTPVEPLLYRDPGTKEEIKISGPSAAFSAMERYGLGISQASFDKFLKNIPARLDGQILLNVDDKGKAYMADHKNNKLIYLGKPLEAYRALQDYLGRLSEQAQKAIIPSNCLSWFDGCNTCFVNEGELGGCTRMMCAENEAVRCLEYSE